MCNSKYLLLLVACLLMLLHIVTAHVRLAFFSCRTFGFKQKLFFGDSQKKEKKKD